MSDSQDWQGVLGIADPAPGDPASVQGLAGAYGTVAENAGQALILLSGAQSAGTGQAMTAFNSQLGTLPDHIQTVAGSYQEASSALGSYATALSGAQAQAQVAWAMATPAHDDLQAASGQVTYWQGQLAQLPASDTTGRAQASANLQAAQSQQGDAQGVLNAAQGLAQQAAEARTASAVRAAQAIDDAANHSIPARSVWQQISDWFQDNPWIAWVLTALSVILPIFGTIGAILGVAAGAVIVASQILSMALTGKWNVTDLVLGIVGLIPGVGELLGAGKVLTKLGTALRDIAATLPGVDRVVSAGDSAAAGIRSISSDVRSTDYLDIRGNPVDPGSIVSHPIYDANDNLVGMEFMSDGDWSKVEPFWQKLDMTSEPASKYYNLETMPKISVPRDAPWAGSGKGIVFIGAHSGPGKVEIATKDLVSGAEGKATLDGPEFVQVVKDMMASNPTTYGNLLKDPETAIYLQACYSGKTIPGVRSIARDVSDAFGRTVYAPTSMAKGAGSAMTIDGAAVLTIEGFRGFNPGTIKTFIPVPPRPPRLDLSVFAAP